MGYSRGGNTAFQVANALGRAGIKVHALILFDAHDANDEVLHLQHANVAKVLNFYQRNPTTWLGGRNPFAGRPLDTSIDSAANHRFMPRLVGGQNYTGNGDVTHLNIVTTAIIQHGSEINAAVGP